MTIHFNAASESSTYHDDIEELAGAVAKSLGDVGSRVLHAIADARWPRSTAVSYWFPTREASQKAFDDNGFDELKSSPLIASDSLLVVQAIEHRVLPKPNTWSTNTGVEPPQTD